MSPASGSYFLYLKNGPSSEGLMWLAALQAMKFIFSGIGHAASCWAGMIQSTVVLSTSKSMRNQQAADSLSNGPARRTRLFVSSLFAKQAVPSERRQFLFSAQRGHYQFARTHSRSWANPILFARLCFCGRVGWAAFLCTRWEQLYFIFRFC